jgi:hypothetical protein
MKKKRRYNIVADTMPSFAVKSSAPTVSVDDADDVDKGRSPDRAIGDSNGSGDAARSP